MSNITIAYVGLGIMGKPAVANLIKAGHSLRVWSRRPEACEPLVELGAVACASAAEAAQGAQFAFTNVSDGPDVEEVIFAPGGYAEGLEDGAIVVDMSTISPDTARKIYASLKEKGFGFIDAPVSGGEAGAINAALAFMCGGDQEDFDKVKPVLEAMGKTFTLVGPSGAGSIAKAANQVIIGGAICAISEAFALAKAMNVDPAKVREAILGGAAGSKVLEVHALRMINDDYPPGFRSTLHLKDINIALAAAGENGVDLPAAETFRERLSKMIDAGHADDDSAVAAKAVLG